MTTTSESMTEGLIALSRVALKEGRIDSTLAEVCERHDFNLMMARKKLVLANFLMRKSGLGFTRIAPAIVAYNILSYYLKKGPADMYFCSGYVKFVDDTKNRVFPHVWVVTRHRHEAELFKKLTGEEWPESKIHRITDIGGAVTEGLRKEADEDRVAVVLGQVVLPNSTLEGETPHLKYYLDIPEGHYIAPTPEGAARSYDDIKTALDGAVSNIKLYFERMILKQLRDAIVEVTAATYTMDEDKVQGKISKTELDTHYHRQWDEEESIKAREAEEKTAEEDDVSEETATPSS